MADTLLACKLEADLPAAGPAPKPFVFLPDMGLMASTRQFKGAWTKILINGNKAGSGHAHEDKGGFVLEHRGETYAMDRAPAITRESARRHSQELRTPQHAHPRRPDGAARPAVAAELRCAPDRLGR
ncbi:MAG: heparinase II/III family protein [Opitutaceae bacterium]|nr:heparinase II/III family protein [Opitutaceae bacterium]